VSIDPSVSTRLVAAGLEPLKIEQLISVALDEDLRYGPDVTTSSTIDVSASVRGNIVARQAGITCGIPVALAVLNEVNFPLQGASCDVDDGGFVEPGTIVISLEGPLRALLLAERTMLNFLTHLSGVATATQLWVDALSGTSCRVRDTRKTLPGLRSLEKYAVRCGGGLNHRMGLGDAALIKDNHIAAAGGIVKAVTAIRQHSPNVTVEVECDTIDQVREALSAGVRLILLDNMDIEMIRDSVKTASQYPGVQLEASGGLTLASAHEVGLTGVDYIAIGALTHSSSALDLALDRV